MDTTLNNYPEVLAMTTLQFIRGMDDLPQDLKATAEASIPALAAIASDFDRALRGTGVDPDQVTAVQERHLRRIAEVGAGALARVQERLNGLNRAMTPPGHDWRMSTEYRAQMRDTLQDPGEILSAYYEAAEDKDDVTMQAVEQAPKWDKAFALSEDQRVQGRRLRWGDQAKTVEAVEVLRVHIAGVAEAVKQHVTAMVHDDPLDVLMAR